MKITRENYEIWFLDYLEGRLNEAGMAELRLFLEKNTDLAEELEAFAPIISADSSIVFPDKELLKKEPYNDPAFFETAVVAAMEGDLNEKELHALERWFSKNPDKQRFLRELEETRLKPDPMIVFPAKQRLKKRTTVMSVWMRVATAAAILVIAMFLFYPGKQEPSQQKRISAISINPKQAHPGEKNTAEAKPEISSITSRENPKHGHLATNQRQEPLKQIASIQTPVQARQIEHVEALQPRCNPLSSVEPSFADLVFVKPPVTDLATTSEIPISDFLNNKLQEIKANGPKGFYSREEVALAGLHLFSRLPGNHLTGKRGIDGRLKSISLNTQLLAISIPVNR